MGLKKKLLGSLVTLVMLITLLPMSVFAAPDKTFTIDTVVYDGTANSTTEKFSTITSITYIDDGAAPVVLPVLANQIATLTVDGVQYDIEEGKSYEYNNTAVINLTTKDSTNLDNAGGPGLFLVGNLTPADSIDYFFRSAAYISGNSLLNNYSILNAIKSGTVNSSSANNAVIDSEGSFFNGFFINNSNYAINNLDMTLVGHGGDDFSGWGAGITVTGNGSNVDIDNARISSTGAIRTAIWAGGIDSVIDVTDSVITAYGADTSSSSYNDLIVPMLKRVPWVLGLEGTTRATNVLGSATANYSDSIVVSDCWGALSTDSGIDGTNALNVSNVLSGIGTLEVAIAGKTYDATKMVNGVTYGFTIANSGYVTYADAGVYNTYDNVAFYAPDYDIILAASDSSAYFTGEDTVVKSNRIGAMWHQNKDGLLSITDGTWSASDIMFLVKASTASGGQDNSCYPNLVVDGTKLNITGTDNYSGVLYQLMDTDDAGGPFMPTGYTIPAQEGDWSTVTEATEVITAADATFKDINTVGDIYNSVYTINEALNVTLNNSKLEGIISSSNANHVYADGSIIPAGTFLPKSDGTSYLALGRIVNTASKAVNNDVHLTLENGTKWVVNGPSYLSSLTIDATSIISAPEGYKAVLTVNGNTSTVNGITTYTDVVVTNIAVAAAKTTSTAVKTGDSSSAMIWMIIAGFAVISIVGGRVYYRRENLK